MKHYNFDEQALAFDRVLPWEGTVKPLQVIDGQYYLCLNAPNAAHVTYEIQEGEIAFSKGEDGIWRAPYEVLRSIQYVQIRIDGVEYLSPLLPITYGYSRPYNYLHVELPGEEFYEIRDVPHGSVREELFFSSVTGEWERCMVYTPAVYETEPGRRFPVLYLQHGHGENEIGWIHSGKAHMILDNLIAAGKAVPFIIVMSNGMVQTVAEDGRRLVNFHLLSDQLINDIIPFIDNRFRTLTDRRSRALAGLSMGSLQTSMIGFSHPELFEALGVFSGFVGDFITGSELDQAHSGEGTNEHLKALEDPEQFRKDHPVFFRAIAKDDPFMEFFERDEALLAEKGVGCIRKIYEGTHDWNVWRKCFYDFAQLIFA